MHRIDTPNARPNQNGVGKAGYSDNTDLSGVDPTALSPDALNALQEELSLTIEAAGIALEKGTNNQLLAAIKRLAFEQCYPVGTPYFNRSDERNPALILGFGTWLREEAHFLVGYKEGDADFGVEGGTSGARDHTMTNSNMPLHSHSGGVSGGTFSAGGGAFGLIVDPAGSPSNTGNAGAADPDPIPTLPPYVVYHWWVRTA